MKTKTLDGKIVKWNLDTIKSDNKSGLHKNAAVLIKNLFPTSLLLEEVQIEVKSNKYLYLDFYLPLYRLAIEIDGQQHSTYNNFLNKNPTNFIKQQINDKFKNDWCELNSITLIRLDYSEEPHIWREKLLAFGSTNNEQ